MHGTIALEEPKYMQGVSENTDTFLAYPALAFITTQTLLGAGINP